MKKLGFGLMRLPLLDPNEQTSIDIEQTKQMVDSFLAQGFTYFDTAWMYHAFSSETAIREALVKRHPRESYTLADKLHAAFIKTKEDRDRVFNEQLQKTGVEYFDYYLLHDVRESHYKIYNDLDCVNWLREKKKAGLVKHMGFSFHDSADFLEKVLTDITDFDFVQLQINYLGWDSESVQSRRCYEIARAHGLDIIVMEPVKGGTLANVPAAAEALFKNAAPELSVPSWAIRFAAGLDGVMVVLSGMSNMAQLTDNTGYMKDFKPLSDDERKLVFMAADIIRNSVSIPCTGCSYCTDGCPMKIAIPKLFSLYNRMKKKPSDEIAAEYNTLTSDIGKASSCIGCGQCESVCPQELEIIDLLKTVAGKFEK